ncbi:MAG: type II toxin-antitoxin system RelE/ParE family toxin [Pseudolabrys sp.]|nr:type II toxin-antitoxin system RelE/ParE family toxin [Pseudolabrys sp.]MDP2298269.1 type II toxin-antitoxin system RelE/ParE family toxin [Pseudolabrys sp.]
MKIRISGKARAELVGIYRYLARRNPEAAEKTVADIDLRLRQLADFPLMGRQRPELAPDLRSLLAGTYIVFYTIADQEITVLRVIDGRMDIHKELKV